MSKKWTCRWFGIQWIPASKPRGWSVDLSFWGKELTFTLGTGYLIFWLY